MFSIIFGEENPEVIAKNPDCKHPSGQTIFPKIGKGRVAQCMLCSKILEK